MGLILYNAGQLDRTTGLAQFAVSLGLWNYTKRMAYLLRQPLNWLLMLNINARKYRNNRAIAVAMVGVAHSTIFG